MASINISTILHDVRVILDQNAEGYDVPDVGEYTLEMDDIIVKSIVPAVQWAHMNAPLTKLKGVDFSSQPIDGNAIQLPDDFMRLVAVRCKNWKRAVSSYYTEDDPYVSQILSGYPGLMPTEEKPALVLRHDGDEAYLLLYPYAGDESSDESTDGDEMEKAFYIPIPVIQGLDDSDESEDTQYQTASIEIESAVYDAFLYYLAHLVKLSYNEDNKFEEQAKNLL